jgi:phospholipid-translocating P-type ATPase (flippase)
MEAKHLQEPLLDAGSSRDSREKEMRTIYVNNPLANKPFKYKKNNISTTKYNLITFLPKNLFEQFTRLANLYFLFIAILQFIPNLSPTGKLTTILPLALVLIFSACKDAYEDYKRRVSDYVTNYRKVLVLKEGRFEETKWCDVCTGDIVKVLNGEPFPADLILLSTSEEFGLCYVETSSLDGETNLKIKKSNSETLKIVSEKEAMQLNAEVRCEAPNNRLYSFEGTMNINNDIMISLDPENILLRGSSLKNTDWIIGIVVYAGHDSKLMMNMNKTPHKTTYVETLTNRLILIVLAFLIFLCLFCSIGLMIWTRRHAESMWYLKFFDTKLSPSDILFIGFKGFFTFLILFNNLIPISLYVSIEIAKLLQASFMSNDLKMYHHESDTPTIVRTSALNEELGQIEYIFSDKTGTLTCNKMELLKFAVDGISYGTGVTEIAKAVAKSEGREIVEDRPPNWKPVNGFQFYDERINDLNWTKENNAASIQDFLVLLAVCHTVIPERSTTNPNDIIYQASSPDEAALVKAARYLGVEFISRTSTEVAIKIGNRRETWKVLNTLEFTSARKRQSCICRDPHDRLILLTKGADNVIFPLLKPSQKYIEQTDKLLEEFAKDGLRTLVCAKAVLNEEEYAKWNKKFQEARCSLVNRAETIEKVCAEIEKDLDLVGITGIEDKLQEGVPEAIEELKKAGIKIWVLTGDKLETAINIGFACNLLNQKMARIIIEGNTFEELSNCVYTNLHDTQTAIKSSNQDVNVGMIIDGQKLLMVFDNPGLRQAFLQLGKLCRVVICCRVSPKQKAEVVSLVKEDKKITLAIGDGANDVSMIQSAHVGVGISGEEGLQAANAADYSIAQFRFLKRLLIVHGRWSYRRISKLILYSFYKNIVLYLTQFWFVLYNGFSGTSIHDKWTVAFYNVFFTAVPIMVLAVYDRDVPDHIVESFPELYKQGHKHVFFNKWNFIGWVANSIYHSAVCFFIPLYCMQNNLFMDGQEMDMISFGICIYTCVLITVTTKCVIEMSSYTWIHHVSVYASVIVWFLFVLLYGSLDYKITIRHYLLYREMYDILQEWRLFGNPGFWIIVVLTVTIACLRDIFWKCWIRNYGRNMYYKVQSDAKKIPRTDILKYFPLEDGLPKASPTDKLIELLDVRRFFSLLKNANYRGFAFSDGENVLDIHATKTGKRHSRPNLITSAVTKLKKNIF